jgi:hypothetical protein
MVSAAAECTESVRQHVTPDDLLMQVGAFEREPRAIAETVQAWAGKGADRSEFNRMVSRAKALGKPDALFSICRDLAALAEHPSFLPGPNGRLPLALQPA